MYFLSVVLSILKDLSKVKPDFKSVPPQLYFEISRLANTRKWRKIQNVVEEECFKTFTLLRFLRLIEIENIMNMVFF